MSKKLSDEEIKTLKNLAKRISIISQDPIFKEKKKLWENKNALKKTRPLILCVPPMSGRDELIPTETLIVKDELFRKFEKRLRYDIFHYENFHDDEIISNDLFVPYVFETSDWLEGRIRPYDSRADHAASYHACINTPSDFKKLQAPKLEYNEKLSNENYELAQEVFGDYLNVELGEPYFLGTDTEVFGHGNSLIDVWCELRGLENVFYDFIDEPAFTKEAMSFLMEAQIARLLQLEREGLLKLNGTSFNKHTDSPLGSNGRACTNELPQPDFDGSHVRLKDLWGYSMAQELTVVSADMLEEFVLPYQAKIADLFGMNAYGCCENNDKKWGVITKHIPRLRALSLAFEVNLQIAADVLKDKYVLTWKPPVVDMLIQPAEKVRNILKDAMDIMSNSPFVIALRDAETMFGGAGPSARWTDIAMELAKEYE